MHTAVVSQFEIAAMDPDVLRRFYALLFGWRFSAENGEPHSLSATYAASSGIGGVINSAGHCDAGGVKLIVEVDDVLENVCYAEELGARIIELPHEIISGGRRVTVAAFADPEGNRVGLSKRCRKLESARELPAC